MIQKIVILPIDDRPCHNRHVIEAMKNMKEYALVYPNRDLLGHFTISGDTQACEAFIETQCQDADALIVSLDALLFGGLVQARSAESNDDDEEIIKRLEVLKRIKTANPKIIIYAYSVIMRLTTTVTDSNNLETWHNIFEYSQLIHRVKTDLSLQPALDDLLAKIPPNVLASYLNARYRNHKVNKELVNSIHHGIINFGVLVQEDTSEFGMHLEEQSVLTKLIEQTNTQSKCLIKNGTDEMVALLLARHINLKSPITLGIQSDFVDTTFKAKYEDRPVLDNLKKSMTIANIIEGTSDLVVLITPTQGKSVDYCFEENETLNYDSFLDSIASKAYEKVGVLDIKNANGGDVTLLENILKVLPDNALKAYSAWNTASNAIGSFLLDMTIATHDAVHETYLSHRILDDAYYQGRARASLNAWMKKNALDVWAMNTKDIEFLNLKLNELLANEINQSSILNNEMRVNAWLPWGRSFEIEMEEVA